MVTLAMLLCGCPKLADAPQQAQVKAANYHNFWLWGNTPASRFSTPPRQLYILQGEIGWSRQQQHSVLKPQGMGLHVLPAREIWLVYRTTHLNWSASNIQAIIQRMDSWQYRGNRVAGLQVDFDAATRNLDSYAHFLQQLRQQLPARYRLSATGLLDWVNHRQPQTFTLLRNTLDEVVLQTYQGRSTIKNYPQYMQQLAQLQIPFKVGLVEHGTWLADPHIERSPYFRGYVVFLLASTPP